MLRNLLAQCSRRDQAWPNPVALATVLLTTLNVLLMQTEQLYPAQLVSPDKGSLMVPGFIAVAYSFAHQSDHKGLRHSGIQLIHEDLKCFRIMGQSCLDLLPQHLNLSPPAAVCLDKMLFIQQDVLITPGISTLSTIHILQLCRLISIKDSPLQMCSEDCQ